MRRRVLLWLGNSLIATGAVVLLVTFGLLGYAQYEQDRATREAEAIAPRPTISPTRMVEPTATLAATATPLVSYVDSGLEGLARFVPTPSPSPSPVPPTPTSVPIFPAQRITAPTIGLDTKVVESPIVNGEWQVPKFVAGHLEGTAQPLENSNVVLSGHVESISSGNVFAKIGRLRVGDPVQLYTQAATIDYVVSAIKTVQNTDMSVVQPTTSEQLTLITCTGTFLPLQHDYNERIVVIANRPPEGTFGESGRES